eukprot:scaffold5342_cov104-Cylindrotheca_fusiformis.AAC.9
MSLFFVKTNRCIRILAPPQIKAPNGATMLFSTLPSSSSSAEDMVVKTTTTTTTPNNEQTRIKRRRRSRGWQSNEEIPSYKEFVHRFTVISLYRNCLKAVRLMPSHNHQEDLRVQVRKEFRANQHDSDPFNIQRAVAEGKRRYQELQDLTGHNNKSEENDAADSWLNTYDPEDQRGRVGTGWPWSK